MNRIKQLEMGMTQIYPCVGDSFQILWRWVGVVLLDSGAQYLWDYDSKEAADLASAQEVKKLLEAGAK